MRPIKMSEIVPSPSEFTLRSTGKTYKLRPFGLEDEQWLDETFGGELEKVFREYRIRDILRIAYHQLCDEDKKEFKAREVRLQDEDGEERTERMGGVRLLFARVTGEDEQYAILQALLKARGVSQPLMEELVAEVSGAPAQKKSDETDPSTGEKFSTSLQPNTDGPSSTSEP